MIGQVLGNRYEIVEKIGTGGMSVIYKAKCRLLNRFVAIKILRPEFVDNSDFIKRFKIEAQAAASLSHPNVVSIYDVGNQGDLYYIVMEYVDGITLKDYIVKQKVLNWKEAVGIAMQICSALEHAHKNGIVHRDIKPHNIILTSDGVVKVTDFGIARAATYFTVTFAGNAIGSVHYFSPEQARGGFTDNRSDIYSLGIVLYEMLTGNVPFEGDSPVSIAFKHLQETAVPPKEINVAVPRSVNDITMKAIAKDLDSRYPNATAMLGDFNEALKHPDDNFVETVEPIDKVDSPTLVIPAVSPSRKETGDIEMNNSSVKAKPKKNKMTLILAVLTSLIIVSAITFVGFQFVYPNRSASEAVVPNLVGKTEDDARAILAKENLSLVIKDRRTDEKVPLGVIISQQPGAGISVKIPNGVEVVVSTGFKEVNVPNVANRDYREANVELDKLGLTAKMSQESSDTVPIGYVVRTSPSYGATASQGSTVEVFVSSGPDVSSFLMPNLIGKTEAEAKRILQENKLQAGETTYQSDSAATGTVIKQSILANAAVAQGTTINLTVSSGLKKTLKIELPEDSDTYRVKVVTIDNSAVRTTVYEKTHKASESPIYVPITGKGKVRVQIYLNGTLYRSQDITFGEAR